MQLTQEQQQLLNAAPPVLAKVSFDRSSPQFVKHVLRFRKKVIDEGAKYGITHGLVYYKHENERLHVMVFPSIKLDGSEKLNAVRTRDPVANGTLFSNPGSGSWSGPLTGLALPKPRTFHKGRF